MAHDHPHDHDHSHSHTHGHGHSHHHHIDPSRPLKAILWGFGLNLAFTLIEIVGGYLTGSVAILADAVHDLGDTAGLALALYFERYAGRRRDANYSFGYRRFSLLSALISGMIILSGSILVLRESVPRLFNPGHPNGTGMLGLAVLGLVVNGAAALKLAGGRTQNERMLSWHFWEDTLGWLATLLAAVLVRWKGWTLADPLLAMGLSFYVMWNVWKQLRLTLRLFLQGTPVDFDEPGFTAKARRLPGIADLHDLHVWSLDGEQHVLSLHVVLATGLGENGVSDVKRSLQKLAQEHNVRHVTIETEFLGEQCSDNCDAAKERA